MTDTVKARQHELLESYEVVLFCDSDEIIAPNPQRYDGLGDYIDRMTADYVNCRGVEVIHQKDTEPPIDLARPILEQRSWWFRNYIYSKPAAVPDPDELGRRLPPPRRRHVEPGPRRCCSSTSTAWTTSCAGRATGSATSSDWNDGDLYLRSGYQNRIVEDAELRRIGSTTTPPTSSRWSPAASRSTGGASSELQAGSRRSIS